MIQKTEASALEGTECSALNSSETDPKSSQFPVESKCRQLNTYGRNLQENDGVFKRIYTMMKSMRKEDAMMTQYCVVIMEYLLVLTSNGMFLAGGTFVGVVTCEAQNIALSSMDTVRRQKLSVNGKSDSRSRNC